MLRFLSLTTLTVALVTGASLRSVAQVEPKIEPKGPLLKGMGLPLNDGKAQVIGTLSKDDPLDPVRRSPAKNFLVKLEAGQRYRIDHMSKDFDAYLRLVDFDGNQVAQDDDSGDGNNARIVFNCTRAGTYQIVATALGAGLGNFNLVIEQTLAPAAKMLAMADGRGSVQGNLTMNDVKDPVRGRPAHFYEVSFLAGRKYQIDLMSRDFDAFLRLETLDGKVLEQNDDGGNGTDSRIMYTPQTPGLYRLIATPLGNLGAQGNYTLTVKELEKVAIQPALPPAKIELRKGKAVVVDMLNNNDPPDMAVGRNSPARFYTIQLEAKKSYEIQLKSKDFDAFLRLIGPNGMEVARDDDSGMGSDALLRYTVKQAGEYRISASALSGVRGGGRGMYTLEIDEREFKLLVPEKLELRGGRGAVSTTLMANDALDERRRAQARAYKVQFKAKQAYQIDLKSQNFDTYLRLLDPDGKSVMENDDGGDGTNSRIFFISPRAGEYTVIATTLQLGRVGDFDLAVEEKAIKPMVIAPLELNQGRGAIASRLTVDTQVDLVRQTPAHMYKVKLKAGKTYQIDLMSKDFDAYLRFEDSEGKQLDQNDDGGVGSNARIRFTAPREGEYRIIATMLGRGRYGEYDLVVEER